MNELEYYKNLYELQRKLIAQYEDLFKKMEAYIHVVDKKLGLKK